VKAFGGSLKLSIETYGKLPFYKDYIAIITSKSAIQWKAFLLNYFGHDNMVIPSGHWPFVYHESPKSDLIVGLIESSSDGIRQFPFSLFTACKIAKGESPYNLETIDNIWKKLLQLREELETAENISECYSIIRGKSITVKIDTRTCTDEFPIELSEEWPRFFVAQVDNHTKLHLPTINRSSSHQCIKNWQQINDG
jgi:hypothetical protein